MSVRIAHASIDERGKASGGAAGDQTGKEVCIRSWYDKGWTVLLRWPDRTVAKMAAEYLIKLCNSNLVGYDQGGRNSLYAKLKKYNWSVDAYIKSGELSEADCSSIIYAVYCCLIPAMRSDSNAPTTHDYSMRPKYTAWGFKAYTSSEYLTTDKLLMQGDVLVKPGSHTVMAIDDGASVASTKKVADIYCNPKVRQLEKGCVGNDVKRLQRELIADGYDLGKYGADGDFGSATDTAVRAWQKANGLTADGQFGANSWSKMLSK